jgi:hypothetical protein
VRLGILRRFPQRLQALGLLSGIPYELFAGLVVAFLGLHIFIFGEAVPAGWTLITRVMTHETIGLVLGAVGCINLVASVFLDVRYRMAGGVLIMFCWTVVAISFLYSAPTSTGVPVYGSFTLASGFNLLRQVAEWRRCRQTH